MTITVNAAGSLTVLEADFDTDETGFAYLDDPFRGTSQPRYANGVHQVSGGFSGGALQVTLGGIDYADIFGMSGGWQQGFTLSEQTEVTVSFRYNLTQSRDYGYDELSQVLVSVDGTLYGEEAHDYVAQIVGNGRGGYPQTTGWQVFEVNLGTLTAGDHTLTVGGYNNKKTSLNESTVVLIDDLQVVAASAGSGADEENHAPELDQIGAKSVTEGQPLNFTVTATDPDEGDTLTLTVSSLPFGASFTDNGDGTGVFNWEPEYGTAQSSPYMVTFTVSDTAGDSDSEVVTITVDGAGSGVVVIRVNAGGSDYVDGNGNLWSADSGYNTGYVFRTSDSISNTTDDTLYQSERWDESTSPELQYSFDVPNGNYNIILHFAECYDGTAGAGLRVFDVVIEGELVLDDLDIYREVGYDAALIKSFSVVVTDGQLSIEFLHEVENPKISAIEVISAP